MPAKKKHVLVLNGPNLNLLGAREPRHYGKDTLPAIIDRLTKRAGAVGARLTAFQSNSEAALVDRIQQARAEGVDFIVINPAAFTHTSVAILDALSAFEGPILEVHVSNVHRREEFRHHSYVSRVASGIIVGCGVQGYELALRRAATLLEASAK